MRKGLKILAILLSLLLIGTAVLLMTTNPSKAGALINGFKTPIIALEFMDNPAALRIFLDVENKEFLLQQLLKANLYDYGFMLLYSLLVLVSGIRMYLHTGVKTLLLCIIPAMAMLAGDALENLQIATILQQPEVIGDSHLSLLQFFTRLKWGSIAAAFLLFSVYFFQRGKAWILAGIISIAVFGTTLAAQFGPPMCKEIMSLTVVIGFVTLMIFSFLPEPKISV